MTGTRRIRWPGRALRLLAVVSVVAGSAPGTAAHGQEATPAPPPPLGLDWYLPTPDENPLRPGVVELGRDLFFDPILSVDSTVACATCHQPEQGFTNRRPTSVGVFDRRGTRNVPAIVNRGYGRAFFWDGRIPTLEAQVLEPIMAEDEMALDLDEAIARLNRHSEFAERFRAVFGRAATEDNLARALSSFVRTIRAGGSRFDRFTSGDANALNELEREGLDIFLGTNCILCHTGTNLTDERFHNTGVAWSDGRLLDEGRALVTGNAADRGAFKTPTLREVSRTAPYMHDGSLETLEDVVDFYSDGGRTNPNLDSRIQPLDLTEEAKRALVAFLQSLTGEIRSGL